MPDRDIPLAREAVMKARGNARNHETRSDEGRGNTLPSVLT